MKVFLFISLLVFVSCNQSSSSSGNSSGGGLSNSSSPSAASCQNVDLFDSIAFGACGNILRVMDLSNGNFTDMNIAANDIAVDEENNTALVLSENTLTLLDIAQPLSPQVLDTATVNFRFFSGVAAANGIAVISGGGASSNVQAFNYLNDDLDLIVSGIPVVDNTTGTPEVSVISTSNGIEAFFSQDLGFVTNWGINHISITPSGSTSQIGSTHTLSSGPVSISDFSSSNFPVESEFLDDDLYVANFATNGIEVINLNAGTVGAPISLGYRATHISTDGEDLFVISSVSGNIQRINPTTRQATNLNIQSSNPSSIAANSEFIVIADLNNGIVFIEN